MRNIKDDMEKSSDIDVLSGLLRPQRGMEKLRRLVDAVDLIRDIGSVGVIFADIFRLKLLCDQYGLALTDDVIRDVGRVVQALTHVDEVACRYGGDEFLLIMPDITEAATRLRANQLRQAAEQVQIMCQGQPQARIILSVGIAHYPSIYHRNLKSKLHGTEALMQAADESLERDREQNTQHGNQ